MTLTMMNVKFLILAAMDQTIEMNIDVDYIVQVKDTRLVPVADLLIFKIVFVINHPFQNREISTFSPCF
jgi:hypothetical protein